MTVFIAHAEADRAAAESLERFLERRGLFVELETGERGFRPTQEADTVVTLLSKDLVFSPQRPLIEKRSLEAWADEKLVLVKLDHAFPPVGLRDLDAIAALVEAQRDIAWAAVAREVQESREAKLRGDVNGPAPASAPAPATRSAKPVARKRSGSGAGQALLATVLVLAAAACGAAALGVTPIPFGLAPEIVRTGGLVLGASFAIAATAFLAAALWPRRRRAQAEEATMAGAPGALGSSLFVSYAHADDPAVSPLIPAMQRNGRSVWIDRRLTPGEGWAGEIVRAIRGADRVVIMCSPRAFESDHVKREVYLADRYKKPLLPVFLEDAAPPEDFEYFLAGVQWLELYKRPEPERPAALETVLDAA